MQALNASAHGRGTSEPAPTEFSWLELVDSRPTPSGVTIQVYRPTGRPQYAPQRPERLDVAAGIVCGVNWGLYGVHRGKVDPEPVARRARLAEEAGLESLWVGDHIAMPAELGGESPRLEAVVAATYLAATTTRVRIGLGVIILPQRQPVLLAKQLTSLDVLSGGRLIVGIGAGYVEAELAVMGVPLAERGARTDEYLAAMRTLWTDPEPSFEGRFVGFEGVYQQPPPRQRPHPPIVVGGHSLAAFRRAIQHANGWYGVYLDVAEATETIAGLRRALARYERPAELGELEITITPPPGGVDLDTARRYAELGVHRLAVQPATMDGSEIEQLIDSIGELLTRL